MSDVEWDDEGFEPPVSRTTAVKDRWEGEDEDDVKDNWDDDIDENEDENKPTDNGESNAAPTKKKKSLKEKIAEKEEKKRLEQEQKRKEQEEEAATQQLSPEEMATEKARQRQLQEESDLLLAVETFGVSDGVRGGQIDSMEPSSKEDFDKFEELLRGKITKYERSPHYVPFLESLFRQISIDLESENIKRLGSTLTALSNEKAKQQKGTKGKKKTKQKASLVVGKDMDNVLVETGGYDEYDDFL